MIKFLETPLEIAQLINVQDDIEQVLQCPKGEIIQTLIEHTKLGNRNIYYILAHFNDYDEIDSYGIYFNAFNPPLYKSMVVLYIWSPLSCDSSPNEWDNITEEFFQIVIDTAKKLGVSSIQTSIEWGGKCLKPLLNRGWEKQSLVLKYNIRQ